jgi:hypothetical protein
MNRTKAGWKQWFTDPLPNIGLFLSRGNNRTSRVFEIAWEKYILMDDTYEKSQPGKDQNHVLEAMRIGRGTFGLKYAYFSNFTAPLMDKMILHHGTRMELGGEIMENFTLTHKSLAIHTTCYEKATKVLGLKAANAFWNPKYYDSLRPTLVKPLIYFNQQQLIDEIRSLLWLALTTKRSLIVPNILGPTTDLLTKRIGLYKNQILWPGFRVVFFKKNLKINILEPSFYWRIQRDYDEIPLPNIVFYRKHDDLLSLQKKILTENQKFSRIILSSDSFLSSALFPSTFSDREEWLKKELLDWAADSVGLFKHPFEQYSKSYLPLPSLKGIRGDDNLEHMLSIQDVLNGVRLCAGVFDPPKGNRTCFQICK